MSIQVPDVFVRIVQQPNNLHLSSYSETSTKDVSIFITFNLLPLGFETYVQCLLFQTGPNSYMFEEGWRHIHTKSLQMAANSAKET